MTIALINTGCANIASVGFALDRLGVPYVMASAPDEAQACDRLILPGVGSAKPAMERLKATGWAEVLPADDRPLLGICLGMQLLFEFSEEDDVDGLGLLTGRVKRLPRPADGVWPHMGWNSLVNCDENEPLLDGVDQGSFVYFVHGYFVPVSAVTRAATAYGADITAIARSGYRAGCQFHPERSGEVGARILANFSGAA